ncbi:hypothetical protein OH76DRAFT_1495972, partial [Lentinus brumalis]
MQQGLPVNGHISLTGVGRSMAEYGLQNGDIVIAAARRPSLLDDLVVQYFTARLLVLSLDVTQQHLVINAFSRSFGRIDVVVNNAGTTNLGITDGKATHQHARTSRARLYVTREAVKFFRESNCRGAGWRLLVDCGARGDSAPCVLHCVQACTERIDGILRSRDRPCKEHQG